MRATASVLAAILVAASLPSLGAGAPGPEEPRSEAPAGKPTPKPDTVRKPSQKEAAPARPEAKKSDPRGMEVEPVDFKKAPEKPRPK